MTMARDRLGSLTDHNLKDGWNGDGSLAPTREVYANAEAMLPFVPEDGWAIPNENGTLTFEWGGNEVGGEGYNLLEIGPTAFLNGTIKPRSIGDDFDFEDPT